MANKLIHKRSSVVTDNMPKLPQADGLEFGEIAINYADGFETVSFKNSENEIVEIRTKEYFENIINENEEVISSALNDLNTRVNDVEDAYARAAAYYTLNGEGKAVANQGTRRVWLIPVMNELDHALVVAQNAIDEIENGKK